eukprot:1178896-Prorocentrum_minimum.AAC.2
MAALSGVRAPLVVVKLLKTSPAETTGVDDEAGGVLVEAADREHALRVVHRVHDVVAYAAVRGAGHPPRLPVLQVHEPRLASHRHPTMAAHRAADRGTEEQRTEALRRSIPIPQGVLRV